MMIRYLKGFLKYFFYSKVSLFALIDGKSSISRLAKINRGAKIVNSVIGRYSYVGGNSLIINTEIGAFCSIANDVCIGLAGHTLNFISTSPIFTEKNNGTGTRWNTSSIYAHKNQRIQIGSDVWIGYRATILNGAKIGDGAVIAASAVVTKDVPPYAIVGGVPAKILRYRFNEETIKKLTTIKWWNLNDDILQKNINLFQTMDIDEACHKFPPPP